MGAIADAFAAFAQPLIDQTDGSPEELQKALTLSQLCFNAALMSADGREEMLAGCRSSLGMSDDEFEDFRYSVVEPMIARHEEMFPLLHLRLASSSADARSSSSEPRSFEPESRAAAPAKKSTVERYAPCPCGSGKKYKFCCGAKTR